MSPAPDEFPDFDSMTPEEQMAWLESLARRQGASADEFLTSADQDIPIPENAVIDEPGYVPYSISEGARMERHEAPEQEAEDAGPVEPSEREAAEAAPAEEDATEEFPPVLEDVEFQADAFTVASEMNDPDDPSARGIADLEADARDEILTDEEWADPMTWLGSLSAQPDNHDIDFLADLERAGSGDREQNEPEQAQSGGAPQNALEPDVDLDLDALEAADLDGFEALDLAGLLQEAGIEASSEDAITSEADDAASWLDTWAVRQGAEGEAPPSEAPAAPDPEAEAGMPLAEEMRGAAADESALRAALEADSDDLDEDALFDAETAADSPEDDVLGGADPMTWLETLARRQGAKPEELTTEADLDIPELPADTVIHEPGYTEYSPFGILPPRRDDAARVESLGPGAAVSDEEEGAETLEAIGQSLGWLTEMTGEPGTDLRSWLAVKDSFVERELAIDDEMAESAQAMNDEASDFLAGAADEETADVLQRGSLAPGGAQPVDEQQAGGELELLEAEPGELPPWLQQMRDADAAQEVAALESDAAPWLEETLAEVPNALDGTETEMTAFLEDEIGADELAEGEPALAEAEPVEMPDWLLETEDESPADTPLPAWLTDMAPVSGSPPETLPDWLDDFEDEVREQATMMDDSPQEPAAEDLAPIEAVDSAPSRAPEIPDSELFATYRHRLEEEPGDHASRLALARTLRTHGEVAPSLDHYETLVENSQLLEDVSNDLAALVEEQPRQPRAQRLLGDTLMRRGRLQEALDAYRSALEQL